METACQTTATSFPFKYFYLKCKLLEKYHKQVLFIYFCKICLNFLSSYAIKLFVNIGFILKSCNIYGLSLKIGFTLLRALLLHTCLMVNNLKILFMLSCHLFMVGICRLVLKKVAVFSSAQEKYFQLPILRLTNNYFFFGMFFGYTSLNSFQAFFFFFFFF